LCTSRGSPARTFANHGKNSPVAGALRRSLSSRTRIKEDRVATDFASDFTRSDASAQTEGTIARSIEQQTAKLPSDTFLWLAVGSMAASAALQIGGQKNVSLFIGQWAPSFLLFGIYNKLVKQLGSDRATRAA
jgi:hypothetical protein